MKIRKRRNHAQVPRAQIMRLVVLCVFFAAGALLGHLAAGMVDSEGTDALAAYLGNFAANLPENEQGLFSALQVLLAYFRLPLLLLLLGCCAVGVAAIPMLCAWEGFGLAFSVSAFSSAMAGGMKLGLAALGLRCAVLIPCTLYLAYHSFSSSLVRSGLRREEKGGHSAPRLGLCLPALLLGAGLEITLVPRLVALVL